MCLINQNGNFLIELIEQVRAKMLLAVNQSVNNSKRRRAAEAEAKADAATARANSNASRELTDSTTQLVANMLLEETNAAGSPGTGTSRSASTDTTSLATRCQSCQHQQRLVHQPCKCGCNCINKLEASGELGSSLVLVYIYLGALTLMLATLSILFYTYSQAGEESANVAMLGQSAFRNQFQDELMRSEHVLRAMVTQIMERDYPQEAR